MKKILGVLTCLLLLTAYKSSLVKPLGDPEPAPEYKIEIAKDHLELKQEFLDDYISNTLEILEDGEDVAVTQSIEEILKREAAVEQAEERYNAVKTRLTYNDEFRVENGIGIARHPITIQEETFKSDVQDYLKAAISAYSDVTDNGMIITITNADDTKFKSAVTAYFKAETIEEIKDEEFVFLISSDGAYVHSDFQNLMTERYYDPDEVPFQFLDQITEY